MVPRVESQACSAHDQAADEALLEAQGLSRPGCRAWFDALVPPTGAVELVVESVAGSPWNGWPNGRGIRTPFGLMVGAPRNRPENHLF